MGHVKSFFSAAMLCTIWLILLQVLGNVTSGEAASVRLVNGINSCSGKVQVFFASVWVTVCYEGWDLLDATVACRELGCGEAMVAAHVRQNIQPSWTKKPKCDGNEESLKECSVSSPIAFKGNSCPQDLYARVICQSATTTRLVNGTNPCSGRVEVLYNGTWGTVFDDGWDLSDAAVVCREMGCEKAIEAKTAAYFGQGSGPVLMSFVDCFGSESTLTQCYLERLEQNNLTHLQDAGVICSGGESSVKTVLRIEVKTGSNVNPNDPAIISKLSEEMAKLQISGPFSWKTQPDGKVFQKVPQKKKAPRTPCN